MGNILLAAFFLEPLANLTACLVTARNLDPVTAGAVCRFGGLNLHNVAVVQHIVEADHATVDLCANHGVTDGTVDGVSKVDGGCTSRQIDDIATGGKDEYFVGEHINLQTVDKVLGIGILLVLQQTANPLVSLLVTFTLTALLIFPVGGDTVLGNGVHIVGANLHLKGNTVITDDRGVQTLVHIGLRGGDIVLEASQNGAVQVMDNTEDIIAVGNAVDQHTEGEQVIDLL